MNIHIHRSGQSYGPYPIDRVRALLKEGRLAPNDLAWYNGAAGWVPLASIPELTAEPGPTPVQPAAVPSARPNPAARYAKVSKAAGYGASICILLYYLGDWVPQGKSDYFPAWWPVFCVGLIVGAAVCAMVCLAAGVLGARLRRGQRQR